MIQRYGTNGSNEVFLKPDKIPKRGMCKKPGV